MASLLLVTRVGEQSLSVTKNEEHRHTSVKVVTCVLSFRLIGRPFVGLEFYCSS
eukprot:m.21012 g.21012  ORF g.21012 m.21012 type:complete len:54 (-) comp9005_c1_seq1:247-408(-)